MLLIPSFPQELPRQPIVLVYEARAAIAGALEQTVGAQKMNKTDLRKVIN